MRQQHRINIFTVTFAALFVVALLVGLMFFGNIWTTAKTYNVSAYVTNARGIARDSTVFEAGLPAGVVSAIERRGPDAVLTLRITAGPRPLPVDSKVQLGLRSLAGETDVLLYPGRSHRLVPNNGSLGLSQNEGYTEVDQILNVLSGPTAGHTRQFVQGLGAGVQGQGNDLNRVLGNTASLISDSLPLTSTLAAQHQQVAGIVRNFGTVMAAIGQRTNAIEQFATGARATFATIASSDSAFQRMLAKLPYVLGGVQAATHQIGVSTASIAPALTNLGGAITALTPALEDLRPASVSGVRLVDALGNASPALHGILTGLIQLKPSAEAALPALHATLCQLDPMIRYIKPYGPDISAVFSDFGAAADPYASKSHQLLLTAMVNPNQVFDGIQTQGLTSALNTLLNAGIFSKAGGVSGYDPATPPGQIDQTVLGRGVTGPAQFGLTHKYPHVTADCSG